MLIAIMTDQLPVPKLLIELNSCKCKVTKCTTGQCPCKKKNLRCTDLCDCNHDCENTEDHFSETDDVPDAD